jgi:hypothetical protein
MTFTQLHDSFLDPIAEDEWPEDEVDHIAFSDRNGIYIPQLFATHYEKTDNVSQEDWDCILAGPWITRRRPDLSPAELFINAWRDFIAYGEWDWDCPANMEEVPNEWYWEAWNQVESDWGYETEENGYTWEYYLHQDGDLFVMKRSVGTADTNSYDEED